ncbi:MAG TPA: hypothetical protein VEH29_16930 [Acidimicrobiales bacterium]|nr:hypothetical protein [Acidimicrobiales bacterium]
MDEIVVNANQLENSIQATTACLWRTTLPFSVDPVLWRFQEPAWTRNDDGETKRNYKRLGLAYGKGTGITLGAVPLLQAVGTDEQWRMIARNAVAYQRDRLRNVSTQLELLADLRDLDPVRLVAPSLVAYSPQEDRINRLMIEAAAEEAQTSVAVEVVVPDERLTDRSDLWQMIEALPVDYVSAYLVWTPKVTEGQLLRDHEMFAVLLRMISELSARGIAVGHQYANYTVAALHDFGLSSVTHHLGWVDKGEPVEVQGIAIRSCQTYVPGVRHSIRFNEAAGLGRDLGPQEYAERYCECTFCSGMFETGHPLDLLLETQTFTMKNGRERHTPTSRAVGANTWHYLLSRRNEVEAFSLRPAVAVIEAAIERASALNRGSDVARLGHLASEIQSA